MSNRSVKPSAVALTLVLATSACAAPMKAGRAIEMSGSPGFRTYKQEGTAVRGDSMLEALRATPQSKAEATKAYRLGITGAAFGAAGGALVGWPVGAAVAGGDPEWALAYAGAGVIAVALTLGIVSDVHLGRAVESYNRSLGTASRVRLVPALSIAPGGHGGSFGAGLSGRF